METSRWNAPIQGGNVVDWKHFYGNGPLNFTPEPFLERRLRSVCRGYRIRSVMFISETMVTRVVMV